MCACLCVLCVVCFVCVCMGGGGRGEERGWGRQRPDLSLLPCYNYNDVLTCNRCMHDVIQV